MKRLLLGLVPLVLLLTACAAPAADVAPTPAPTVTVTVTASPVDDEWQRFRDDPKAAFIFASAYEIIWGAPIGNGETADTMVELAHSLCKSIENGVQTWESMRVDLGADESADKAILTAQMYCPELDD